MAKPYYTLCIFDAEQGCWHDDFGDYSRKDVQEELEGYDMPRKWLAIIKTDGSAADMMAKRDALPMPKGYRNA